MGDPAASAPLNGADAAVGQAGVFCLKKAKQTVELNFRFLLTKAMETAQAPNQIGRV